MHWNYIQKSVNNIEEIRIADDPIFRISGLVFILTS